MVRRLIEAYAGDNTSATTESTAGLQELTAREIEVLRLVARGLSNADLSGQLVLSEATVKTHLNRMMRFDYADRTARLTLEIERIND